MTLRDGQDQLDAEEHDHEGDKKCFRLPSDPSPTCCKQPKQYEIGPLRKNFDVEDSHSLNCAFDDEADRSIHKLKAGISPQHSQWGMYLNFKKVKTLQGR